MQVIGYIRVSTKTQIRKGQGIRIYHERIDEEMTDCDCGPSDEEHFP